MQISEIIKNTVINGVAAAAKKTPQNTVNAGAQAGKSSSVSSGVRRAGPVKTRTTGVLQQNSWQYKPDGTRKTFDELTNAEVLTWISTLDKSEQQGAALDFETNYLKNPGSTRYDPYYTSYSNNDEARALFGVNTFDQKWIDANRDYYNYLTWSSEKYTSPKAPGKYASDLEKAAYQYWLIANTYEQTTQAAENEYAKLRAEIAEKAKIYRASGEGVTAQELLDGIDWSEYETLENLREASRAGNGRYLNRPVQVGDSSLTAMINAALRGEDVSGAKDYLWEESRYILSGGSRKAQNQTQAAVEAEQADERAYNTSNHYDPYYADISNNAEARALFGVETFDQAWIDANRGKYMQYIDFGGEDKKTPVKPGKDASQMEKDAYQYWLIANTYEETTREGEKELEKLREWMAKKADRYTAEEIVGQIDWEDYPTLQNMREVAEAGNARMINRPVKAGDESLLQMARELTGEIGENADVSDVSAPDPEAMVNEADSDVAKAPANGSGYWDWWQQFGQVMGDIVSVSRESQKKAVDISDGIQYNEFVGSLRSSMSLDASIAFMRRQASALNFVASEEDKAMYRQQLELLEMERDERQRIEERVRADVDAAVGGNGGRNLGERIIDDLMQNLIISGADQVPIQDYEAYLKNHMGLEAGQNPEMDKYDAPTAGEERAGLIALGAAEGFDKAATATTQGAEYVLYEIKRRLPWNQGKTKEELYYTDGDLNALHGWNQQFSRKWVEDSEHERLAAEYPVFNQVSMGVSELIKMTGQTVGVPVPGMSASAGWYGLDLLKNGGKVARTLEGALGKAVHRMPFFLDSYAQTYETALEEGATEDQAGMAAAINALISTPLSSKVAGELGKLGGSVTRLFTSRIGKRAAQKGLTNVFKTGWGEALLAIGKAAISEGAEEAIEEPIQSGIAKLVYDQDRAWYGEGAVVDPQAMLESGVGGAIAGPMFTVASGLSDALGQTARQKSEEILERTGRGEIVPLDEIEELARIEAREAEIQDATETLTAQRQPEIDAAGEKAQAAMDAATAAQERAEAAQAELNTRGEEAQPVMQAINEGTASYEDPEVQKEVSTRSDAIKQAREGLTLANTELAQEQTKAAEAAQEAQETIDRIREEARTEATAQVDANIEAERQAEAQAAADQKEAVRQEVMKQIAGKETPGVKELHTQNLSADQLGQMRILDALGRQYNVEIDVVDTLGGANGMYAGGRHVVVALDALEGAYVQTAAHEMVHYIKQASPEAYSLLETEVAQYLIDNDLFDFNEAVRQRMEEYRAQGIDADEEYAIEEIIAETVPAIFSDENVIRDFVDKNRTLAQKIRDFFVEFAEKLRKIALNYAAENDRYEISAMLAKTEESADVLYDIAEAFDAAMEMAGEADGTAEAEGRYSLNNAQLATGAIRGGETREMMGKAAGKTLKEYKSSADRAETAARLSAMSEAYAAGKDAEAAAIADQLAREIIEKSSDVDMSVRRQYAETRKRLREEGLSLTDTQKQETANQYGSYNDFRKSLMGSVMIKNDAKSLDAIWSELSGMHPEMFPAETGEGEMPGKLMEFVQAMKPKYVNPYGMDMEGAAADLSLRLQSDVLGMINEPDRAKAALADANALRERYSRENSEKRRQAREERQKKFREAADKLFAAREAGDAEAEQAAVDEYRKLRAGTSGRARLADAAEAGIQIRKAGREIGRLDRLIAQMNETIEGKDLDNEASIERLIEERKTYIEMRDQLKRQQNALHRQEMISRAGMDAAQDADEWEADVAMNDVINVDTAEHIDSLRSSIHDKVKQLEARMKAKMADYNMTSTIDVNDVEFFFEDVLGEMQMQSGMAKVWEERLAAAESQLEMEKKIQQQLQKRVDLHEEGDGVDVNALRVQISEAKDRIDALESARRTAEREAAYARRVGAESLQKALREGRLPQPIMERVIAIFSEAGRRGKFNSTLLMQNMEANRLNYTTAARVWDDLFGDMAPIIRGIYYDPVMDNETDRQKWINEWRGRISQLKLTKKESEAVQRVGEGKLTLDEAVEFGSVEKIQQAVELFRQFYDEAWDMADRAMVRNGYESPGKRARYFPHIDESKNFWQKLGLPIESSTLPTSINGLTETFSPGKQYSGHLQHREGDTTDYDALAGFEEYIASVSNVIYHTDDIQRMRQLETEIRAAANNGLFKSLKNGSGKEHLSEFVKWVHEYTNLLAGKKSTIDRGSEGTAGRPIYRMLNKLRSMKGRSAVLGNLASAITNFVPVQQVMSEHPIAAVKAAAQLHMGSVIGQGNVPESQYLIRRFGSDSVVKTAYTRFSKAAGWGFEAADHLASKLVVATYYQANLDMGMDSATAMRNADAKAARLMGDRSKGAMPNAYGSQIVGFLTQFQYEVANQSQHFRKDIWREKGLGKGVMTVFMTALTGWLFNEVQEKITGRRSAMDPIDMTMEAWKVWQDKGELLPVAQSIYNNVSDIFPYIGMLGDGGRITAFEGISDLFSAMLAGDGDLGYAARQFAMEVVPAGGQIKKSWRGALALARGGYYNSKGDKLYFPVDASNPFEAAQALIFGPTSIRAAVDYYAGEADALTASETKAYQQDMARGMTAPEAYQNEVKQAQAEDLMAEAKETEETPIDAEKQQAAGIQLTPEGQQELEKAQADADTVDAKRDEARALREQTVPSELMSDRYWALKDSDQLKAAIRLWQISGDDWAMPYTYDEMRKFTIDGEAEYLGPELTDFANKYYEDEYMTLMEGVDPERMDEEELADLKVDIEKIKTSLDKELRKMIEDERR